ncbi:hypothetical protein BDN72DRAFT_473164 [Pluteus cervinus]|uniref:Uncharacterized protein n=1 Tax=Pluteus cervinus TaxID=181527 RepID=A0ACD3A6H0_9AGAR|nr:hypothetical protein BDN72DRAFT_473164 [Pluteus cervinus]
MLQRRIRHLLPSILLLFCVTSASARKGTGGGAEELSNVKIDVHMDLSPVNEASFAFYIILSAFTTFQTLILYSLTKDHNANTLKRHYVSASLGAFLLVFYYIFGAVYVSKDLTMAHMLYADKMIQNGGDDAEWLASSLSDTFQAIFAFSEGFADVLVMVTVFTMLDYRGVSLGDQIEWPSVMRRRMQVIAGVLFTLLSTFVVLGAAFRGAWRKMPNPPVVVDVVYILYHFNIAFYFVVALFLAIFALHLWIRAAQNKVEDKIIRRITTWIVPLLLMRSLLEVCVDIIESITVSPFGTIDYEGVMLADVLISGTIYFVIFALLAGLGSSDLPALNAPSEPEAEKAPEAPPPAPPVAPPPFPVPEVFLPPPPQPPAVPQ